MEAISKYFPQLSDTQVQQFKALETLYSEWNAKINVISRKDIGNIEVNHILHSLGIAKFISFSDGTKVLDFGTGGGFPGIPLAVMFPHVNFHLVDRIGKKITVAKSIAEAVGLHNVTFQHGDIKEVKGSFDFVVSRAVMNFSDMTKLVKRLIATTGRNAIPNGLICLKGGDLTEELAQWKNQVLIDELKSYFKEPYFETKKVVYLPI